MRIKLNHSQAKGIHLILTKGLDLCLPGSIETKLYHELTDQVNEKLRKQLRKESKAYYSLSLNSIESKGLYCWYIVNIDALAQYFNYEVTALQSIGMEIHKRNA